MEDFSKNGKSGFGDWMKKNKILVIIASAVLVVAIALSVILLGGSSKEVESVNISKSNLPQTTYVLGNDLDFTEGKLTVVIDGERTEVALNDPKVVVSGYDKNKLGEQIVTVTYNKKSTTIKVTVVPRMTVVKYEASYFVGEPLNLSKGTVTVTADNGESEIINLNDASMAVTGFDSTTANSELPLTLTYTNGETTYQTTFNVTIYEATEVEFKAPTKKAYKSHDLALSVDGGYIALKNTASEYSKYVTLTADMVSGFDLSQATLEHRQTALTQTLSVDYCGYVKTYDIQIKFSDYSLLHQRAQEMANLTWTSTSLPAGCNEEMGENALEAMGIYFNTEDDISLLEEGEMDCVAKVAAVYGLEKWQTAFAAYSDAFYLTEAGVLSWNCENFDKTEAAYNNILNKDPILYNDAAILVKIAEEFTELVLFEEELVADKLSVVYSPDTIDAFSEQLKLMIDLYNAMKNIPDDWTLDMLKTQYADEIQAAWELLYETEYKATQHRTLYFLVNKWRANKDYFDILYQYYYDVDKDKINAFKDLRLPGALEELYSYILEAKNCVVYMQNGLLLESTQFMFSYEKALEKKEQILQSGDEMQIDLYNNLEFDYLVSNGQGGYTLCKFDQLFTNFRSTSKGYLSNFNAFLGVEGYEALWDSYMAVLNKCSQEGYLDSAEFGSDAEKLLKDYLALTPKQQFSFMCLLHPYYMPTAAGRYPLYTWENDGSESYHNQFVGLIYTHYNKVLPETTREIFTELMMAAEDLANLSLTIGIDSFLDRMENVSDLCERVSKRYADDWATFNDELSWLLIEYQDIEEKFSGLREEGGTYTPEELTDAEMEDFRELLETAVETYAMMMTYQAFLQQGKANVALAFYAPMEKMEKIVNKILSSDDPRILRAFYFDEMVMQDAVMPDGMPVNFGGTMDMLWWFMRKEYTAALTGMSYLKAGDLMWDNYQRLNVKDFLADASYLYHTFVYMNLLPSADENYEYFDAEKMQEISYKFHYELNDEQRYFIFVLDSNFNMYANSFMRFAKERNTSMASLVEQLMKVERIYTFYKQIPDGADEDGLTYLEMLLSEYELLLDDYAELESEIAEEATKAEPNEKKLKALEDFQTYFGDMFEFYKTACEALK